MIYRILVDSDPYIETMLEKNLVITKGSLDSLENKAPRNLIERLAGLLDVEFRTDEAFCEAVERAIGHDDFSEYQGVIRASARKVRPDLRRQRRLRGAGMGAMVLW